MSVSNVISHVSAKHSHKDVERLFLAYCLLLSQAVNVSRQCQKVVYKLNIPKRSPVGFLVADGLPIEG